MSGIWCLKVASQIQARSLAGLPVQYIDHNSGLRTSAGNFVAEGGKTTIAHPLNL